MMHPDPDVFAAGDLRHQVQVQAETDAANAAGEQVPTWKTVVTLRAQVEASGGAEQEIAGQTAALSNYRVKHRYYPPLTTQMRYLWGALVLEIASFDEGGRRIGQIASCVQRK